MTSFRSRSRTDNAYDLLPPERAPQRTTAERLAERRADVVDAEFTVIADARPARMRQDGPHFSPVRPGNDNRRPGTGSQSVCHTPTRRASGAVGAAEHMLRRLSDNVFSALVALVFLFVFAFAGGISALAMAGAAPEGSAVADIGHVTVTSRTMNGLPTLVVSGVIENRSAGQLRSPRLRANIYSGERMIATTLFNPRIGAMGPGESRGFQARLPYAGGKAPDVRVSFAE